MATKQKNRTLQEIRMNGMNVLAKHLGIVGMIRFLQYENQGSGNYSKDRHKWLIEDDLNKIIKNKLKIKSK